MGFVVPTLLTTTTEPVGNVPLESDVVTVNGVILAPEMDGVNPLAANEPVTGNGLVEDTSVQLLDPLVPVASVQTRVTPCAWECDGASHEVMASNSAIAPLLAMRFMEKPAKMVMR
jgi:hypothetical protein